MIIKIPSDLRSYEPKSFGNFTTRQGVCMLLCLVVVAPLFSILYILTDSTDLSSLVALLAGAPFALCGFMKKDGIYLEKVVLALWVSRARSARKRKYVMQNWYEDMEAISNTIKKEEETLGTSTETHTGSKDHTLAKALQRSKRHPL